MEKANYYDTLKGNIAKSLQGTDIITSEGSVFNDNLGLADLTKADVTKVNSYVTTFTAAGLDAVGDMALANIKSDPAIQKVTASISCGDFGNVNYDVTGKKATQIPPKEKGGEPTPATAYGSTRIGLEFVAGEKSGLLGQVRSRIKSDAKNLLGEK
mgnify:CR=1 FL=1